MWPSGKASEFGSAIQRFESFHPSKQGFLAATEIIRRAKSVVLQSKKYSKNYKKKINYLLGDTLVFVYT